VPRTVKRAALGSLLADLDKLGLTDVMPQTRDADARVAECGSDIVLAVESAQAERAALPRRVADGELTTTDAIAFLEVLAPWLSQGDAPSAASKFVERVREELAARVLVAAKGEAGDVHARLSALAAEAVEQAVGAAGELVNVADVARRVQALHWDSGTGAWSDPDLLELRVDPRDVQRGAALSAALSAEARIKEVHAVGAKLRRLTGAAVKGAGTALWLGADPLPAPSALHHAEQLPDGIKLAVMSALGWEPGYHYPQTVEQPRTRLRDKVWQAMRG